MLRISLLAASCLIVACAAPGHAAPPGSGESVWIHTDTSGTQLLRMWRSGKKLRIYYDDGVYPGDGKDCAWGTLRGTAFRGKLQRIAPDPLPVNLTISRTGSRLRLVGMDASPSSWHKSTLGRFSRLVPAAETNPGGWCEAFRPMPQ